VSLEVHGPGSVAALAAESGALIAVAIASVLRGRGGDAIARAAGSGVLDEGSLAAQKKLSGEIDRGEVTPPGIVDTEGREQR
jgi:hypothetical protein